MTAHTPDITDWIGRTERVHDDLALTQALAASAMFDAHNLTLTKGDALPPLWQWFYFLPRAPQSQLDVDGHPQRGGFMPPVALPRRMFAGARVTMHQPLRLGVPAVRDGVIQDVTSKSGRSGALAFVTVRYSFVQDGVLCMEEEQDIVYREPGAPVPAPEVRPWPAPAVDAVVRDLHPDSRLLFRFSALTFNAHRIHYDRAYALQEEGYPGLVVHGPLNAMLLMQLAHDAERQHAERRGEVARPATQFSFRGVAPVFDTGPIRLLGSLEGNRCELEALAPDGATALRAEVTFGTTGR
jgi:3-methylfumaryl-CoA hydratase